MGPEPYGELVAVAIAIGPLAGHGLIRQFDNFNRRRRSLAAGSGFGAALRLVAYQLRTAAIVANQRIDHLTPPTECSHSSAFDAEQWRQVRTVIA